MESKSDFSNLLKDYRKKNGLTQKAFASLVGLSYDTIIGYEHGRSKPSPVARKKIAEKTGIEIALIPQGKNGAKIDYSEPLTDEEREFAEINHSEIWKFLRIKRLSFDEWYDTVVQSKFVFTDQTLKRCRFLTLHFAIWNQHFPTRDGNKHAVLGLSVFTIAVTPTLISL